jgi:hypothetical protein
VLFIMLLAGTLATSVLACPLWMGSPSQPEMPCSHQDDPPDCPLAICQASSPYLPAHVGVDVPLLELQPAELVDLAILWTSPALLEWIQQADESPPGLGGPLFLRGHSLLI